MLIQWILVVLNNILSQRKTRWMNTIRLQLLLTTLAIIEKEITFLPAQELEAVKQFKIELLAEGAQELIQT